MLCSCRVGRKAYSRINVLDEAHLGLEEERRLAYVGLTRARQRIEISHAANRRIHNLWQSAIPSRFIEELPKDQIEVTSEVSGYGGRHYGGASDGAGDTWGSPTSGVPAGSAFRNAEASPRRLKGPPCQLAKVRVSRL